METVNRRGVTPVFQPARADWKVEVTDRRFMEREVAGRFHHTVRFTESVQCPSFCSRYSPGVTPISRLKATLR